ncbi:unnamed protein product [Adineta steineri]|uniref:NAD(P)(+)--arginine ADP-ribosyltransferase n=2 Tax=Adineta steineri TaxID=433720 RepID=A0A814DR77_9BILA|nr:unnamed protein product [Adineta steineri]CAF0998595.1 unnamed protein product [Adineta steineri]
MGSGVSKSKIDDDDDFYNNCKNGNVEQVHQSLLTMNYKRINHQRKDGNTPLHTACINNHKDIIILLLNQQDICARTLQNKSGKTAYDCTNSIEIQQLFRRSRLSTIERFCENHPTLSLQPILSLGNEDEEKISHEKIPDDWFVNAPLPLKTLMELRTINEAQDNFEIFLEKCFQKEPGKRDLIMNEYEKYKQTKNIEYLLKIYTFESSVYKALQQEMNAYTTIIFLNLKKLINRTYKGTTYRGAQMTQMDVDAYKWAEKSQDYILETRLFQSTSITDDVAKIFGETDPTSDKFGVLFIYIFDEKCPTAINLQGISHFEDEEEILLLPFTLFKVEKIVFDKDLKHYVISLRYISSSKKSFFLSWWDVKKNK